MRPIYILLFNILVASHTLFSQVLDMELCEQEQNQWCWAATSQCVLRYYGDTDIEQCDIANYTRLVATWHDFGNNDCCVYPGGSCNYWNYNYNYDGAIDDILLNAGDVSVTVENLNYRISESDVADAFAEYRPMIIRTTPGGSGHFIVLRGYNNGNIYYMDPWFGEGFGYQAYGTSVNGGEWTHTQPCITPYEEQPPVADFSVNTNNICPGQSIDFTDESSFSPESWLWTFQGGTPASSNQQNPTVTYASAGIYDVTLQVSNSSGSDTKTESGYIIVDGTGDAIPYFEDLEGSFPPGGWQVVNPDNGITWEGSDQTGYQSSKCMIINNADYSDIGQTDDIIIGMYDFSGLESAELTFYVAYTKYDENSQDELRIYVSTDCGDTWEEEYYKNHLELETVDISGGSESNNWVPSSDTDWRLETVDLTGYIENPSVMIKFNNTTGYGTRIWIDDINLTGEEGTVIVEDATGHGKPLVYPACTNDKCTVKATESNYITSVTVFNINGSSLQKISPDSNKKEQVTIDLSGMTPGMYILNIDCENKKYHAKVIKN